MATPFVPEASRPPERLEGDGFRLELPGPAHPAADHAAWSSFAAVRYATRT